MIPEMKCVLERCNFSAHEKGKAKHWDDTRGLGDYVWPIVREDVLHHVSFCCEGNNETLKSRERPFPTSRVGGEHVGSVHEPYLPEGKLRPGDVQALTSFKSRNSCNKFFQQ